MKPASIRLTYWDEVRTDVKKVAPEFAGYVDEIDPGKKFPLYLAEYPYGDIIVDEGLFYIPLANGELVPVNDPRVPAKIQQDFAYCIPAFPAGVILNNSIELIGKSKEILVPKLLYEKGAIFALWGELPQKPSCHPAKFHSITAGARSIFMLPNIGDLYLHKYLRKAFGLPNLPLPKDLFSQWLTFKELIRCPSANCEWHTKLIFFTNNWLEHLRGKDSKWTALDRYLLQRMANASDFWRNKVFYDYAFSCAQADKNLRPNPYIADTSKWLVIIGLGENPGFGVANDNSAAPIDFLQKVYVENYGLRYHVPTIIQPITFSVNKPNRNAYYSLAYPIAFEFSPKSRKVSSALDDLIELQHVTKTFISEIIRRGSCLEGTRICEVVKLLQFDYFHYKVDAHNQVRNSKELATEDSLLLKGVIPTNLNKLADASAFFRGCVKISVKKN